jgi:hypothetical protein
MDINRVIPWVISHSITLEGKDLVNHDIFYNSLLHVVVCIFTTRIIQFIRPNNTEKEWQKKERTA